MLPAAIEHGSDPHKTFTAWANHQGVKTNAVAPSKFPGRGIGVAATRMIREGQTLVTVPISVMLSVDTVPREFKTGPEMPEGVTVHGLLAAFLTVDIDNASSPYAAWRATWPSAQDFNNTMPLLWSSEAQALLPPTARAMLHKQKQKFQTDIGSFTGILVGQDKKRTFTDHWVLVNTRTLYYVTPGADDRSPPADRIALCPFIDYFNHADMGCRVEFNTGGYKVIADRTYEPGEEIHVTYARRNNDYLLINYGFILPENRWDELSLDHLIIERLTELQEEELCNAGYYGNYVLNREGVCYRTQVAVRLLFLPSERWLRFVLGKDDEKLDQRPADEQIVRLLIVYAEEATDTLGKLQTLPPTFSGSQAILTARWTQIQVMLTETIRALSA
ncbi:MAG: hypothetical protein M1812_005519 [Candelaria pacifica]|nr:MAG: hypothetical protein M1812_005519 [Candelaria pacifica]